jgi:tRNA (adenine37-N6)-methyltransferase
MGGVDRRQEGEAMNNRQDLCMKPIGEARTPYRDWAPHQPVEQDKDPGKFRLVLHEEYAEGLLDLERFTYIYVLSYLDRDPQSTPMTVSPPWAGGKTVGLFASRAPVRPNPVGLSIVRVLRVQGNEVVISPVDLFDRTPILDIKPYFKDLDAKADANHGWADDLEDREHVMQHVRGLPNHDHGGHTPGHGHDG